MIFFSISPHTFSINTSFTVLLVLSYHTMPRPKSSLKQLKPKLNLVPVGQVRTDSVANGVHNKTLDIYAGLFEDYEEPLVYTSSRHRVTDTPIVNPVTVVSSRHEPSHDVQHVHVANEQPQTAELPTYSVLDDNVIQGGGNQLLPLPQDYQPVKQKKRHQYKPPVSLLRNKKLKTSTTKHIANTVVDPAISAPTAVEAVAAAVAEPPIYRHFDAPLSSSTTSSYSSSSSSSSSSTNNVIAPVVKKRIAPTLVSTDLSPNIHPPPPPPPPPVSAKKTIVQDNGTSFIINEVTGDISVKLSDAEETKLRKRIPKDTPPDLVEDWLDFQRRRIIAKKRKQQGLGGEDDGNESDLDEPIPPNASTELKQVIRLNNLPLRVFRKTMTPGIPGYINDSDFVKLVLSLPSSYTLEKESNVHRRMEEIKEKGVFESLKEKHLSGIKKQPRSIVAKKEERVDQKALQQQITEAIEKKLQSNVIDPLNKGLNDLMTDIHRRLDALSSAHKDIDRRLFILQGVYEKQGSTVVKKG
jgi:hypothetical protein